MPKHSHTWGHIIFHANLRLRYPSVANPVTSELQTPSCPTVPFTYLEPLKSTTTMLDCECEETVCTCSLYEVSMVRR